MRRVFRCISLLTLVVGCSGGSQPSASRSPSPSQDSPGNPTAKRRDALRPGEQVPALVSVGWLNGPPPNFGESEPQFVVIDVWGKWCSEVPKSIHGLKQLREEFGPKGVALVSLTTESRGVVEQFVNAHEVPWPSGYRTTLETINALGALNANISAPGYEVRPILYLVDSLGHVVWSDDHKRMDHGDQDKTALFASLRNALESQLDEPCRPSKESGLLEAM